MSPSSAEPLDVSGGPGPPPRRWVGWVVGLALLVGFVVLVRARFREADPIAVLAQARPEWVVIGVGLHACRYLADASVWRTVLRRAGDRRSLRTFVPLGLGKLFVDQVLPSGGIGGTMLIVRGLGARGAARPVVSAAVVLDVIAYYVAHATAALTTVIAFAWVGRLPAFVLALVGVFSLVAFAVPLVLLRLMRGTTVMPRIFVKLRVDRILTMIEAADGSLVRDGWLLGRCVLFHLTLLACDAASAWAMLRAVGGTAALAPVVGAFVVATLARIVGIVPGGVGTYEAASTAMLTHLGVPIGTALAATLLFRAASFWLPLLPGLVFAHREAVRVPTLTPG